MNGITEPFYIAKRDININCFHVVTALPVIEPLPDPPPLENLKESIFSSDRYILLRHNHDSLM